MAIADAIYLYFVHETNPYTAIMDIPYGIHYVKVDIPTNKPLNSQFRFRLSCIVLILN